MSLIFLNFERARNINSDTKSVVQNFRIFDHSRLEMEFKSKSETPKFSRPKFSALLLGLEDQEVREVFLNIEMKEEFRSPPERGLKSE